MANKFLQGKYSVRNPSKYKGNHLNVIFRSSWENKLCRWLDTNANVIKWSSETVIVPYVSPKDDRIHRYFIDFYAEIYDNKKVLRKFLIEVKPFAQTQEPKPPKKQTRRFLEECVTYKVNQSKWASARAFASVHGFEFIIMDETSLGITR